MNHLSDVQHESDPKIINHKLNFVKFLLNWYPNTNEEHEPDTDYQHFKNKHPNL